MQNPMPPLQILALRLVMGPGLQWLMATIMGHLELLVVGLEILVPVIGLRLLELPIPVIGIRVLELLAPAMGLGLWELQVPASGLRLMVELMAPVIKLLEPLVWVMGLRLLEPLVRVMGLRLLELVVGSILQGQTGGHRAPISQHRRDLPPL